MTLRVRQNQFRLVFATRHQTLQKRYPDFLDRFEKFLSDVDYELISDPDTRRNWRRIRIWSRDLTDVAVALTVIAAKVDYLISEDKDFHGARSNDRRIAPPCESNVVGNFLARGDGVDK